MPTFFFQADNREGKAVTESIDAPNLKVARELLETRGFTAVEFLNGELAAEMTGLFRESDLRRINSNPQILAELYRDNSLSNRLKLVLKRTWFLLPILALLLYFGGPLIAGGWLLLTIILVGHGFLPSILMSRLTAASLKADGDRVRFWARAAKLANPFMTVKLPVFHLDSAVAAIEAREGNVAKANAIIDAYAGDPKVADRLRRVAKFRNHAIAREYEALQRLVEEDVGKDDYSIEEAVDYAVTLAAYMGRVERAREVIALVEYHERTALQQAFIYYATGVVDCESGDFERAEFHLAESARLAADYQNNDHYIPFRMMLATFLGIVYSHTGRAAEASVLFERARPFLEVHRDEVLLRRIGELE